MKRLSLFIALTACALFAGTGGASARGSKAPASALVRGGTDIVVQEVRTYAPSDSVAGTNDEYYVVKFTFTNDLGFPLVPKINHFTIEDQQHRRFLGADSGSTALIGISNYDGTLKVGDAHEYTVGFRVPLNTIGLLVYDPTF